MSKSRVVAAALGLFAAVASLGAFAVPQMNRGPWFGVDGTDGTLRGRDAVGSPINLMVGSDPNPALRYVYDTRLDLTWLADWNLNGAMTWDQANTWATGLTAFGGGWSLPQVLDLDAPGCDYAFKQTDCGFNVYADEVQRRGSPLAHMFFDTLANMSKYDRWGIGPLSGHGLINTGPFFDTGMRSDRPYAAAPYGPNSGAEAWYFSMSDGQQGVASQADTIFYAVAVRPGDVALVPEPNTYLIFVFGLLGTALAVSRRRSWATRVSDSSQLVG
jgi:hypothetical protein